MHTAGGLSLAVHQDKNGGESMNSFVQDFFGLKEVEEYHSYNIYVSSLGAAGIYAYKVTLSVNRPADKVYFELPCLISDTTLTAHGKSAVVDYGKYSVINRQQQRQNAENILREKGLKRVHGIIDLERFEEGKPCEEYWITFEEKPGSLSDSEICDELLRALYRIRRWCPKTYESVYIDVDGFCGVLGISRDEYLFNAKYLLEGELIHEAPSEQLSVDDGYIYITNTGIDMIRKESMISNVIATIFNETEKFVNAELIHVCPEAATKLIETYDNLMRDESTLRAKQIALACRDILQDFTDAIYKNAYLKDGEESPTREQTKNKVRYALREAAEKSSKTKKLIVELSEYLNNYFGALNDYIQRNIHIKEVTKEAANRCVIYTYLFIADILRLLKV